MVGEMLIMMLVEFGFENGRVEMETKTIRGWEVRIGKQARRGWLAIAERDDVVLSEHEKTKKSTLEAIDIAIEVEMDNPWWRAQIQQN